MEGERGGRERDGGEGREREGEREGGGERGRGRERDGGKGRERQGEGEGWEKGGERGWGRGEGERARWAERGARDVQMFRLDTMRPALEEGCVCV